MTNGEMIQKVFNCEVCEPVMEDDIIHVIFSDKNDSAIGFDWSWWIMEYKEPKTGHWKAFIHSAYHGTGEDGEPVWREVTVYHCSQCNRRTVIKEKFCPNCGAKMVEAQEVRDKE